jgi:hypothetical protein
MPIRIAIAAAEPAASILVIRMASLSRSLPRAQIGRANDSASLKVEKDQDQYGNVQQLLGVVIAQVGTA